MAKMKLEGFEEYERALSRLTDRKEEIIGACIYTGAKVVADSVKSAIKGIPVVKGYGWPNNPLPGGVTAEQKAGLIEGFGISKARNDGGFRNVKLGFDGYNSVETERWPTGQPNAMIARACESGTSFKRKYPFMRQAVNGAKAAAVAAMKAKCDEMCAKEMK